MDPADYPALATEIATDPTGLGYAAKTSYEISQIINAAGPGTIEPEFVPGNHLLMETDVAEFEALTAAKRDLWLRITNHDQVPIKSAKTRSQILAIWGAGTATRAALATLQTRAATRAEVLFGESVTVSPADVTLALGG